MGQTQLLKLKNEGIYRGVITYNEIIRSITELLLKEQIKTLDATPHHNLSLKSSLKSTSKEIAMGYLDGNLHLL